MGRGCDKLLPDSTKLSALFQRSYWARGRVLGGSSTLNYMQYVRGNRRDYDQWAEQGNEGWSYKDVLPYFIKSEDNYDEDLVKSGIQYSSIREQE